MVLVYNTDHNALASTGAVGHDTYFKAPGKHKEDVLAKQHWRLHSILHKETDLDKDHVVEVTYAI